MSIDLKKLENKLDETLSNETSETLNKFLTDKTMSNNKQSSVEWLIDKLGKYNEEMIFLYKNEIEQAKAMHKEESQKIFECGRNFQLTGEGTFEQVYNETFGGNK